MKLDWRHSIQTEFKLKTTKLLWNEPPNCYYLIATVLNTKDVFTILTVIIILMNQTKLKLVWWIKGKTYNSEINWARNQLQ